MSASLSWLDLTASDRDKVRRVLDLFNEQGTVDELGLGSLRDTISNALFPGTSVLHTRLRYVLFIPWIYQELESWGAGYDVDRHAREMEIQLIYALAESDDTAGVIGIDAGESLSRLASNAYWALLVHWGLFVPARPQSWYHRNFDELLARRANVARADDPGVTWTQQPTWHPRLPEAPGDFPASADFGKRNRTPMPRPLIFSSYPGFTAIAPRFRDNGETTVGPGRPSHKDKSVFRRRLGHRVRTPISQARTLKPYGRTS